MTDLRKRGSGGTLQARVWRALRNASQCAAMLAEQLGVDEETCRKACYYLRKRGAIEQRLIAGIDILGRRRPRVLYAAIGRLPTDRRGKPAGCRNHRGAIAYASWVRMMHGKHGGMWLPPARATAIERHWPSATPR